MSNDGPPIDENNKSDESKYSDSASSEPPSRTEGSGAAEGSENSASSSASSPPGKTQGASPEQDPTETDVVSTSSSPPAEPSTPLTAAHTAVSTISTSHPEIIKSYSTLPASNSSSPSSSAPTVEALAGGIVGAFFAGAVIASLVVYMFGKHRSKKSGRREKKNDIHSARYASHSKSSGSYSTPPLWERYLPQSVDDTEMAAAVNSVLQQVALHVINVYGRKPIPLSDSVQKAMDNVNTGLLPSPLSELMMVPDLQTTAMKHGIAYMLTTKMTPCNNTGDTLLPAHLATIPPATVPGRVESREMEAALQAHSTWKALTAYLFPEPGREPSSAALRRRVTTELVEDISAAFGKWESATAEGSSPAEGLARIADAAFEVGTMIALQASAYRFEWRPIFHSDGKESNRLLVEFPAFVKVADERGFLLDKPSVLVQAKTHQIGDGGRKRSRLS